MKTEVQKMSDRILDLITDDSIVGYYIDQEARRRSGTEDYTSKQLGNEDDPRANDYWVQTTEVRNELLMEATKTQ